MLAKSYGLRLGRYPCWRCSEICARTCPGCHARLFVSLHPTGANLLMSSALTCLHVTCSSDSTSTTLTLASQVEEYVCSKIKRNPVASRSAAAYLGEFTAGETDAGFTKGAGSRRPLSTSVKRGFCCRRATLPGLCMLSHALLPGRQFALHAVRQDSRAAVERNFDSAVPGMLCLWGHRARSGAAGSADQSESVAQGRSGWCGASKRTPRWATHCPARWAASRTALRTCFSAADGAAYGVELAAQLRTMTNVWGAVSKGQSVLLLHSHRLRIAQNLRSLRLASRTRSDSPKS